MSREPILSITGLSAFFGDQAVLREVHLTVASGETLAIIGESGAGKTTLGLSILGLTEAHCTGSVCFRNTDLIRLPMQALRALRGRDIAMVFQNDDQVLHPLHKIRDQVKEAITVHESVDPPTACRRAVEMLRTVGLPPDCDDLYPHQLSGGERQRVLLAMAIVNDPSLLVLDEPTASLDPVSKAEIASLLKNLIPGRAALLITHDLAAARALADRVAVMYSGCIIETGSCDELFDRPSHPYTRALLRAFPDLSTLKDLQSIPGPATRSATGCPFHPRCSQRVAECSRLIPLLQTVKGGPRQVACHRGGIVSALAARNITKAYNGRKVLSDVSLELFEGETLALLGRSGSGKTTLAKVLMGLQSASAEYIAWEGKPGIFGRQLFDRAQMVFQNPSETLSPRLTIRELVREPLDIHCIGGGGEKEGRIVQALREVDLPHDEEFLGRYRHQLSGGEAQRVAIARALIMNPKVLIADEITSNLDAGVQARILRLLLTLQENRGLALLLITHDIALARKVSDHAIILERGCVVESGPAAMVLSHPSHPHTASLLSAAPRLRGDSSEISPPPHVEEFLSPAKRKNPAWT
jgi:peptide/nickel transport system ATP-binding protein